MSESSSTTKPKSLYQLRMRALPKPEYRLMRALIERYSLVDESELFAVALRMLSEVARYKNGEGQQWIYHVIDSFRNSPDTEREDSYIL